MMLIIQHMCVTSWLQAHKDTHDRIEVGHIVEFVWVELNWAELVGWLDRVETEVLIQALGWILL